MSRLALMQKIFKVGHQFKALVNDANICSEALWHAVKLFSTIAIEGRPAGLLMKEH